MSNLAAGMLGILGLVGGACLVIQASLNARLRTQIQSVSWAGFISYVGGTLVMALALGIARVPLTLERVASVPFVWWLGSFIRSSLPWRVHRPRASRRCRDDDCARCGRAARVLPSA